MQYLPQVSQERRRHRRRGPWLSCALARLNFKSQPRCCGALRRRCVDTRVHVHLIHTHTAHTHVLRNCAAAPTGLQHTRNVVCATEFTVACSRVCVGVALSSLLCVSLDYSSTVHTDADDGVAKSNADPKHRPTHIAHSANATNSNALLRASANAPATWSVLSLCACTCTV